MTARPLNVDALTLTVELAHLKHSEVVVFEHRDAGWVSQFYSPTCHKPNTPVNVDPVVVATSFVATLMTLDDVRVGHFLAAKCVSCGGKLQLHDCYVKS